MSFNKLADFENKAKEAERQFVEDNPPEPTTPIPPVEAAPVEEPPVESTPIEATPVQEPPKNLVDEDKYKAAVKAMNESQREAANLRKAQEEAAKKQVDLEDRLNELIRQAKAPSRVEEDDDLESDMPEVAKIAEKKVKNSESRLMQELNEIKKRLDAEENARKQQNAENATNKMRQAVLTVHPDFDDVVNSEEMQAWVNNEAPPIFKAIYDGSVPFGERDVIAVVSQFKSTLAPKAQAHSKPNAADIAAPVRTSPVISTSALEDRPITEAELNDFMHNAQRKTPAEMDDFNKRLDKYYGKPN